MDVAEAHVAVVDVNAAAMAVAIIVARRDIIGDDTIFDRPGAAIDSAANAGASVLRR